MGMLPLNLSYQSGTIWHCISSGWCHVMAWLIDCKRNAMNVRERAVIATPSGNDRHHHLRPGYSGVQISNQISHSNAESLRQTIWIVRSNLQVFKLTANLKSVIDTFWDLWYTAWTIKQISKVLQRRIWGAVEISTWISLKTLFAFQSKRVFKIG